MSSVYKYQQTSVYGVCEEEMSNYHETKCACFWDYLIPFTRFWGIVTSIVLCGVGVDITAHHHTIGLYFIIGAILVFLLEITWAVTLFLQVCIRNEYSAIYKCWDVVLWCGLWKRSIFYSCIAVLLFLKPNRLWLSIVSGIQLLILAMCYVVLTFRSRLQRRNSGRILLSQTPSQEDRFDDITEILDDSLPGPVSGDGDNLSDLDQDAIIEM